MTAAELYPDLITQRVKARLIIKKGGTCSHCCIYNSNQKVEAVLVCLRYAPFDHRRIESTADPQSLAEALGNLALLSAAHSWGDMPVRLIVATADDVDGRSVQEHRNATSQRCPIKVEFMTPDEIIEAFRREPLEGNDR